MKQTLTALLLIITSYAYSQISGVVINSKSKEPIPYVNICLVGKEIGTSSNEDGSFKLNKYPESDSLIFSAIGFKTTVIAANTNLKSVELNPETIQIDEVIVSNKKIEKKLVIGDVRCKMNMAAYMSVNNPWIIGKAFGYTEKYNKTPYLKKIRILTDSNIDGSVFNLRIYELKADSTPGELINDKNIIVTAKKGTRKTSVDLSEYNILFPENGLFVAIEALLIESNKYEFSCLDSETKKKIKVCSYEPSFWMAVVPTNYNNWVFFKKNVWMRDPCIWSNHKNPEQKESRELLLELTLTN